MHFHYETFYRGAGGSVRTIWWRLKYVSEALVARSWGAFNPYGGALGAIRERFRSACRALRQRRRSVRAALLEKLGSVGEALPEAASPRRLRLRKHARTRARMRTSMRTRTRMCTRTRMVAPGYVSTHACA